MTYPFCFSLIAAASITLLALAQAQPDEKPIYKGVVLGTANGTLEMTRGTANRILYIVVVPKDAPITCDGKPCKLEDLKRGMEAEVTATRQQGKNVARKIEAKTAPMK